VYTGGTYTYGAIPLLMQSTTLEPGWARGGCSYAMVPGAAELPHGTG
jgi:hypothetical protein